MQTFFWDQYVHSQLHLGIDPSKVTFNELPENSHFKTFQEYEEKMNRWKELSSLNFLNEFKHLKFFEIQGHCSSSIDLLTTQGKINFDPKISSLEWENLILYLCLITNTEWNNLNPFSSFYLNLFSHPCRVSVVHASLSSNRTPKIFIRFHQNEIVECNTFLNSNDNNTAIEWIKNSVHERNKNILICGPTGAGKTTFLKSISNFASPNEHIICIEDTEELFLEGKRITSLLSKNSQTMSELCHYAMRMSPERIILGEIRGKEIIPLSLMLNTGHQGLLSTVHSSSAETALHRLALLFCLYQVDGTNFHYQYALKFLAKQFHVIIHLENKKIKKIINVLGADQDNIYYEDQFNFL